MSQPQDSAAGHPHDFDVQKRVHQQIRNDPDYDDWEYGTEPLPHEAWAPGSKAAAAAASVVATDAVATDAVVTDAADAADAADAGTPSGT